MRPAEMSIVNDNRMCLRNVKCANFVHRAAQGHFVTFFVTKRESLFLYDDCFDFENKSAQYTLQTVQSVLGTFVFKIVAIIIWEKGFQKHVGNEKIDFFC